MSDECKNPTLDDVLSWHKANGSTVDRKTGMVKVWVRNENGQMEEKEVFGETISVNPKHKIEVHY